MIETKGKEGFQTFKGVQKAFKSKDEFATFSIFVKGGIDVLKVLEIRPIFPLKFWKGKKGVKKIKIWYLDPDRDIEKRKIKISSIRYIF